MNFVKKHVVFSILILIILLSLLFILGETAVREVAQYVPPASTQTAAVSGAGSGLVAHYTFDDGTATDSSGNGNTGTVNGATPTEGKVGSGAMSFDGVGDSISMPLDTGELGAGMTVSFWFKNNVSSTASQRFFQKGAVSNGNGYYYLEYQFGNRLWFQKDGSTDVWRRSLSAASLPTDSWTHIVLTYDGSNSATGVNFYKNATLLGTDFAQDGVSLNAGSGTFSISPTGNVQGSMDDVRVYNRALSADEVSEIYTSTGGQAAPVTSTCTTFVYSSWGMCTSGSQTRTVTSSSPSGCVGGSPLVTQSCSASIPDVPAPASASTVSATSCNDVDIQNAINAVTDQGVVLVPAGTCTWTKSITATGKSLILKGAGVDQTTILQDGAAILFDVKPGHLVRMTGFTFDGSKTGSPPAIVSVHGLVGQPSTRFRIDHNKFVNITRRGIIAYGAYGLIDNNTFIRIPSSSYQPTLISVIGDANSWSRPQDLGTSNNVFIEDNTFIHNLQANGPFDMYTGARYVFRNNKVYGNGAGHHGFDSSPTGVVNFEIYDNTFTNASPTGELYKHGIVFEFRSGSGVVFNNTAIKAPNATNDVGKYDGFGMLRNYRSGDQYLPAYKYPFPWDGKNPPQGVCDGNSSYDGNFPGMKGYPCRDQIGRTGGVGADGKQTFSPVYAWNNNFQGVVGGHLYVQGYGIPPIGGFERVFEHIVEGRDYFNGIPRPGYTPYTYPHPLSISGFTSDVGGPIITVSVGNAAPPTPQAQAPTCTSFAYSSWGACTNGTQTRIITTATPSSCTGGSPETLVRSCTVTPQATSTVVVNPPVNQLPETTIPPANIPLDVIPRTVVPNNTPAPNFISRFIPSLTSTTRTPTTPSIVTKPRTTTGPFVPLPELTPEETVTTTKLSFTEQIKSILTYILQRIQNGFLRIFGN